MRSARAANPVLVVGLDGATFELLDPWLEQGELPCLSRLCREGIRGTLDSVIPPLSPEAWSTFMTGKHPGLHGVMNFVGFRPGTYQLQFNNGGMIRGKTLWRLLSEVGKRVGVMGVPMTYPPEQVNGYLVSGIETPGASARHTYPEALERELREAVGGYDLHGDFLDTTDPETYLSRLLEMVDNHASAACYLLEHRPADLSMMVFGATDRVQHGYWRYLDSDHRWHDPSAPAHLTEAVKAVYRRVDGALAALLARLPEPRNVLVMSDHGCGPCHTVVDLNQWLAGRGYLALDGRDRRAVSMVRRLCSGAAERCPRWLKELLKTRLPGIRGQVASLLLLSQVNWPRTQAFAISTQHGYIYLNRKERFPQGVVEPGPEAERLCERLTADLGELRESETGEPIVERVVRPRELYGGPACDALPDLIVMWREGYISRVRTDVAAAGGSIFRPTGRTIEEWSGSHRMDGILIAHGPDFATGTVEGAGLADLAPTLLHLLGQPVPDDMTGEVLEQLLSPQFLEANPVRYSAAERAEAAGAPTSELTPEESEEVAERLRRMGYL